MEDETGMYSLEGRRASAARGWQNLGFASITTYIEIVEPGDWKEPSLDIWGNTLCFLG